MFAAFGGQKRIFLGFRAKYVFKISKYSRPPKTREINWGTQISKNFAASKNHIFGGFRAKYVFKISIFFRPPKTRGLIQGRINLRVHPENSFSILNIV